MKNFKEIADKCLSGKLKGTFKLASGKLVSSDNLEKRPIDPRCTYQYQMYVNGVPILYNIHGTLFTLRSDLLDVIDFIPNNMMQKKIEIDIPEGKVPVMEQTEKGVVITWKEKELTYTDLYNEFRNNLECIHSSLINSSSQAFYKKVEVLSKLTNIRNYFGKPDSDSGYIIHPFINTITINKVTPKSFYADVIFAKKEHAEQAIRMLGDELKYLFEPW